MDRSHAGSTTGRRPLAGLVAALLVLGTLTVYERQPVETVQAVMPTASAVTTFDTPGEHAYTVPDGVTRIAVIATGGTGGDSPKAGGENRPSAGGPGAVVRSALTVTPGQVLYAVVGSNAVGGQPGANGGGAAPSAVACPQRAGAGGGAADLRTRPSTDPGTVASRILIAAGGGGAGTPGNTGYAGDGGARDEGGRNGQTSTDQKGTVAAGRAGQAGQPAGAGSRTGTADTGGGGGAATSPTFGCGGGGGGGYGGGAGGSAATDTRGGGGGGGGGSLDPDGGGLGVSASAGTPPSVTIDATPVPASTLHVSSDVYLTQVSTTNCPSSCVFCGIRISRPGDCPASTEANPLFDSGFNSQQNWGAAGLRQTRRLQAGVGLNSAPKATPAELGTPFPVADFAHFNIPIRGDSPTALAIGGHVVVQPPGGDPVDLPFGAKTDEFVSHTGLNFLETDNTPPCDPTIQISATPCDDLFEVNTAGFPPTVVRGVTWHLNLLGFDDLHGGYGTRLITEEGRNTDRGIFATLTVDTNPTTTALTAGPTGLTAQVAPVPSTGGTVAFTDASRPVPGCEAVPVDTTAGTATCTNPGPNPVTAAFSGGVGFAASASPPATYRDTTPPSTTVALTPATPSGTNGWYTRAVSTAVTATDAGTVTRTRCALDPATPPSGYDALPAAACPSPRTISADGTHTLYAASIDNAGNKEPVSSTTVKIDKTPPVLAPTVSNPIQLGATNTATPHATDATSGVATAGCAPLDTGTVGDHTVACTATDVAGNTRTVNYHYTVQYRLTFTSPAAGSTIARGQTVPVKITLTDVRGATISDAQAQALVDQSACRVRFAATGAQTRAPRCMTYDPTTDTFLTNWLLPKTGAIGSTSLTVTVTYPNTTTSTVRSQTITVG